VVPVVARDLREHLPLIDMVVRSAGGAFLDTDECASGVVGAVDDRLREIVIQALKIPLAGGERLQVGIVERAGRVQATIDGQTGEHASQGLRTVFGIAASLFANRLRGIPFAVVTYDETELDDDLAVAVWELFTQQLRGVQIASIQTLVVLVEAPSVDFDRHCARGSPLAFRLGTQGVERRKSWDTNCAEIDRQKPREDGLMVVFLGAGFSASSKLPLGDTLRDAALGRLFPRATSAPISRLIDMFYRYVSDNERWLPLEQGYPPGDLARSLTLERVLREEIHRHSMELSPTLAYLRERNEQALARPGPAVRALRRLMARRRQLVVVTVNFDTLVETGSNARVFATPEEFGDCPAYLIQYHEQGGEVPVLKLHGTLEKPETIVATVDAIAQGLSATKTTALQTLVNLGRPLPWVYVGYSMRDRDLESVLALPTFYEGLDESWVDPFPAATARSFTAAHRAIRPDEPGFWQRSITETADAFFEELAAVWGA
jgi:hypothetical protein